ncbi:MAG: type IV pilus twitching motility protein PilT [Sedimentisphaerales bacterium]|nr:type IV pilus twitching motility protein PilT [Sedimentisphaerales bacterium]MBN2843904.1 type IV pilus twitching motility protein PilT [Sedimentisphaerales bacterium]
MTNLQDILIRALDEKVSDIHIVCGAPPLMRKNTILCEADFPVVTPADAEAMVKEMVSPERFAEFETKRDLDFSTEVKGKGRFRVNAHYQRESVAIAFRSISDKVPLLENLNLPEVVEKMVDLPRGLVLVTGDTGSGKSTTMASIINEMNKKYRKHIITLEDPVEYVLRSDQCVIEQREIGSDCPNFASGLRHALRQDPDVILVGEMRDLETTSSAITAAETGHLVFSTLHTMSASQTIERIIDIYPSGQQNQIRSMLANTLQAVISQVLFRRIDQTGMIPGVEILLCTAAVRNCIRENRVFEIPNIIETSRTIGMQTRDFCITQLCINGNIDRAEGLSHAIHPEKIKQVLSK